MTGRTHLLAAGILGMAYCYKTDTAGCYVFACVIGGLFPDTDHRKSKLGRWVPLWLFFRPHRMNLLHSLPGALLFSLPWLLFDAIGALFFFLGYVSHLVLDILNPTGVRLFWPKKDMISIANIKTGSWLEWPTLFLFYLAVIAYMSL